MEWQVHRGTSVLSAVTGDSQKYVVHLLTIDAADDLHSAFTEFWRCLLVEGPKYCKGAWDIVRIEFCSDAGLFTAVFTTLDRRVEQPGVFKLSSQQIESEYLQLLAEQLADGTFIENFESEHKTFVAGYWQLLCEAARKKRIQALLRDLRKRQSFRVYGALIDSTELLELDVFGPGTAA